MKRTYIAWVILSFAIMLFLPWAAVTFVKSDAGLVVVFLLFYAINPIFSAVIGYFSGKNIKKMWSLPVICAIAYLLGAWLFFNMGDLVFVKPASIYLVIGIAMMFLSAFFVKRIQR